MFNEYIISNNTTKNIKRVMSKFIKKVFKKGFRVPEINNIISIVFCTKEWFNFSIDIKNLINLKAKI